MAPLLDRRAVVLSGIGGSVSVVAANAWMNSPSGFTLDSDGNVTDVDPLAVIFNDAMPLAGAAHDHRRLRGRRLPGRLGLRGRACCGAAGTATTGSASPSPFSVAAIAMPIQMGVGDSLARWVFNDQPIKFAAIELVPETSSDVPETLLGHLNDDGTVTGGIQIPGLASWLSDPSTAPPPSSRASTRCRRRTARRSGRSTSSTWRGT